MSKIHAEYNCYGYTVFQDGKPIYGAGNCSLDSCVVVRRQDPSRESLKTIAKYAEQTAREIAEERGAEFTGIEQIPARPKNGSAILNTPDCIGAAC